MTQHSVMVSSLMDSRFSSIPPCPTPALASNIYNLFIYNHSLQVPFSFNHVPLSLTSQLTTHEYYISLPHMVFECRHNIPNQPVSTTIPSPSSFRDITTIRKQQHLGEILKYAFSYVFQNSFVYSYYTAEALSALVFIRTHKNEFICAVTTSLSVYYLPKNCEF